MWFNKANPEQESVNWINQKQKLKARFPTLSDTDMDYTEEMKEEMLSNMQVKLAKARVQLNAAIDWL